MRRQQELSRRATTSRVEKIAACAIQSNKDVQPGSASGVEGSDGRLGEVADDAPQLPPLPATSRRWSNACRRGERAALHAFYERYRRRVFSLIARIVGAQDAEELAQEVFLRAFHGARRSFAATRSCRRGCIGWRSTRRCRTRRAVRRAQKRDLGEEALMALPAEDAPSTDPRLRARLERGARRAAGAVIARCWCCTTSRACSTRRSRRSSDAAWGRRSHSCTRRGPRCVTSSEVRHELRFDVVVGVQRRRFERAPSGTRAGARRCLRQLQTRARRSRGAQAAPLGPARRRGRGQLEHRRQPDGAAAAVAPPLFSRVQMGAAVAGRGRAVRDGRRLDAQAAQGARAVDGRRDRAGRDRVSRRRLAVSPRRRAAAAGEQRGAP